MNFLRGIFVATTAMLASAAAVVTGATSSQLLDELRVVSQVGVAYALTNDINVNTYNGGKKSAAQHHAQKSRRMAERRARVIAAIAATSNDDINNPQRGAHESSNYDNKAGLHFLSRMTEDELELAYLTAEASSRMRGLKVDEFNNGGEFIRRALQELKDNEEEIRLNGDRKLWGNGGNSDPYEPSAGLAEETSYYGEYFQLSLVCFFVPNKNHHTTHPLFAAGQINKHRQVATGVPFPRCVYRLYPLLESRWAVSRQ